MIKQIENLPRGVIGFESNGKITTADYENLIIPVLNKAIAEGKPRFLFIAPDGFEGMELGAAWDDMKFGFSHYFDFRKIAVVTDDEMLRGLIHVFRFMMPAETRLFRMAERAEAESWLQA